MSVSWQGPSGDALDRLMRDGILEHMRKALGSVRCSHHHKEPNVRVHGRSLEDLSWEIEACCPVMHEQVDRALEQAFA